MPLLIELDGMLLRIPKYNLELPYHPPHPKLEQAALEAFGLLRNSVALLHRSSRSERAEAMELLKAYGEALFHALIPLRLRPHLAKAKSLIFKLHGEAKQLPLELIHDGASFLALTIGVTRTFAGKLPPQFEKSRKINARLETALFSYSPIGEAPETSPHYGNRFITSMESLPLGLELSGHLHFQVNGQASRQAILKALQKEPDLFFFSGYDEAGSWLLYEEEPQPEPPPLSLKEAFMRAAARGLRVLLLNCSGFLSPSGGIEPYQDFGVPLILAQQGRLERSRTQTYFREWVLSVLREDSLLKAHRHALNQLYSTLPLSWDWAFMRFYVHEALLETEPEPLRPFFFAPFTSYGEHQPAVNGALLAERPFAGNPEILRQLYRHLLTAPQNKILWLRSLEGQSQEEYLLEFFRRIQARQNFSWKLLYYQRWGYHQGQTKNLTTGHFAGKFNSLFETERVLDYFDESLIPLQEGDDEGLHYLSVYYPPEKIDPIFELWLEKKQKQGWQVILLSHSSFVTEQPTLTLDTGTISLSEIQESLEEDFPPQWEEFLADGVPPQMRLLPLLRLIVGLKDEELIEAAGNPELDAAELYMHAFAQLLKTLSHRAKEVFLTLYLMRVRLSDKALCSLVGAEKLNPTLQGLLDLSVIECDLEKKRYWLPSHLWVQIKRQDFLPPDMLKHQGQVLLKNLVQLLEANQTETDFLRAGSQYALSELATLGLLEAAIQRNLQYARKLSRKCANRPNLISQHVITALELSFLSEDEALKEKSLLSALNILEHLPQSYNAVELLEWFLEEAQKNRNWPMVAEILTKLANLYTQRRQPERAVACLTSALQLSADISHYESRYKNLIAIALLFLELGEFDKLKRLIEGHEFDPALLSERQLSHLWLIDGHLLFYAGEYQAALTSLQHFLFKPSAEVSPALWGKSYVALASIYKQENNIEAFLRYTDRAATLLEEAGLLDEASEIHQDLAEIGEQEGNLKAAVTHLEWLFHYQQKRKQSGAASQIAHKLGGLFFKIDNQLKSTEYYKLAQGFKR